MLWQGYPNLRCFGDPRPYFYVNLGIPISTVDLGTLAYIYIYGDGEVPKTTQWSIKLRNGPQIYCRYGDGDP